MNKRTIYIIIILATLTTIYLVFLRNLDDKTLINRGNKVIAKIEEFRLKEGRLPNGYNQLELKELNTEELFYQKVDSLNFILWFGTSLGESMIYYSDSKEWEDGYREIKK